AVEADTGVRVDVEGAEPDGLLDAVVGHLGDEPVEVRVPPTVPAAGSVDVDDQIDVADLAGVDGRGDLGGGDRGALGVEHRDGDRAVERLSAVVGDPDSDRKAGRVVVQVGLFDDDPRAGVVGDVDVHRVELDELHLAVEAAEHGVVAHQRVDVVGGRVVGADRHGAATLGV